MSKITKYFISNTAEETQMFGAMLGDLCYELFQNGRYVNVLEHGKNFNLLFVGISSDDSFAGKSTIVRKMLESFTTKTDDYVTRKVEDECPTGTRKILTYSVHSSPEHYFEARTFDAAWVNNRIEERLKLLPVRNSDGIEIIEYPRYSPAFRRAGKHGKVNIYVNTLNDTKRQIDVVISRATEQESEIVDRYFNELYECFPC